eukprot:3758072-Rhodomonas_salina.1
MYEVSAPLAACAPRCNESDLRRHARWSAVPCCLSVWLAGCRSVCLSVCRSVCLSVCLSVTVCARTGGMPLAGPADDWPRTPPLLSPAPARAAADMLCVCVCVRVLTWSERCGRCAEESELAPRQGSRPCPPTPPFLLLLLSRAHLSTLKTEGGGLRRVER